MCYYFEQAEWTEEQLRIRLRGSGMFYHGKPRIAEINSMLAGHYFYKWWMALRSVKFWERMINLVEARA